MIAGSTLYSIAHSASVDFIEEITYPSASPRYATIPGGLHPLVRQRVEMKYSQGLFVHQARGIEAGLDPNRSVCVATPTASGKTLIFTSVAASRLLMIPESRVLALYPAKALLQDQERKWRETCAGLDLSLAIIHGGIEISKRLDLLSQARIVLMTPDVLHAWLMAKLDEPEIQEFLQHLQCLVLDEAHIYDGVFGTNMAYLIRRLRSVSTLKQVLASSATIGDPSLFLSQLTGFDCELVSQAECGASVPEKTIMLCRVPVKNIKKFLESLIRVFSQGTLGRFLVFVDSRKRVEELAGDGHLALHDSPAPALDVAEGDQSQSSTATPVEDLFADLAQHEVLPYRAGYEEADRDKIQQALTSGSLLGVITTSALELGIDIGDIDVVVLLGVPPSVKSFWQRAGRAGRKNRGAVILLDLDGRVTAMGLQRYLTREPEPNWLYLDNEYLQYANALCAAEEQQQSPSANYYRSPLETLPHSFIELLDNEIKPTRSIPQDLFPLKQQAINGPHRAFPLRNGIEKSYQVMCKQLPNLRLGNLSYSQVMREGHPGSVYRYLGEAFRVVQIKHATAEIFTVRESPFKRTSPLMQTVVFPQFSDPPFFIRKSQDSFISECRLQVSERVIGFQEWCGQKKIEVIYGAGNHFAQKPLTRFIDTTGVCFHFPQTHLQEEKLCKYIWLAFCRVCSVQERDVGWGTFVAKSSPL